MSGQYCVWFLYLLSLIQETEHVSPNLLISAYSVSCVQSCLTHQMENPDRDYRIKYHCHQIVSFFIYIFLFSYWHNVCVPTYQIYHNRHFLEGLKHVYYLLGINMYSICIENLICLFDIPDIDYSSNPYILSTKYFHIPCIQLSNR